MYEQSFDVAVSKGRPSIHNGSRPQHMITNINKWEEALSIIVYGGEEPGRSIRSVSLMILFNLIKMIF